jgi:hypothetical protein
MKTEYVLMVPMDYNEKTGTGATRFARHTFSSLRAAKAEQRRSGWQWSFIALVEVKFNEAGRTIPRKRRA